MSAVFTSLQVSAAASAQYCLCAAYSVLEVCHSVREDTHAE